MKKNSKKHTESEEGAGTDLPDEGGLQTAGDAPEESRSAPEAVEVQEELPEASALEDQEPEEVGAGEMEADAPQMGELETIQEEMDRVKDQYLRLAADFENYRKRVNADVAGVWTRAQADLVRGLLDGLDDLQRVSQFTSDDTTVETLIEGVDLVERKLLKALTDAGLEVVNPEGEAFDPNTMEAMMRVPAQEEGQDETVHQVFQKGYRFKEQLVRPARVSVYKDDD